MDDSHYAVMRVFQLYAQRVRELYQRRALSSYEPDNALKPGAFCSRELVRAPP
jgi:hypothetical protein